MRNSSVSSVKLRSIIALQAIMFAWIGFTHGSGLEMYAFKFFALNYKQVQSFDHNVAGMIGVLSLLILWKAEPWFLMALSLCFGIESLARSSYGGDVTMPYPLLLNSVLITVPLALSSHLPKLQNQLLKFGLLLWGGTTSYLLLNGAPFYLDGIQSVLTHFMVDNAFFIAERALFMMGWVLAACTGLLVLQPRLAWVLAAISCAATALFWRQSGGVLIPETILQLSVLIGVCWLNYPSRPNMRTSPIHAGSDL